MFYIYKVLGLDSKHLDFVNPLSKGLKFWNSMHVLKIDIWFLDIADLDYEAELEGKTLLANWHKRNLSVDVQISYFSALFFGHYRFIVLHASYIKIAFSSGYFQINSIQNLHCYFEFKACSSFYFVYHIYWCLSMHDLVYQNLSPDPVSFAPWNLYLSISKQITDIVIVLFRYEFDLAKTT